MVENTSVSSETSTAVVTGGANGIGRAIAKNLLEEGYAVVIVDIGDELRQTTETLSERGEVYGVSTDVSDRDAVESLFAEIGDEFGRLDLLVNNAGIFQTAEATVSQSVEEWELVIDVHLKGTYLCSKFARPLLSESTGASVVNMSSVASLGAFPYRTAYGPAKSAINMLTKVLAIEWATVGIRVNAIAPGYIHTERTEERIANDEFDPDPVRERTPLGELGDPDDVARAVSFLVSEQAGYITGVVLPVDGGWSAYGHV